jgi:signal transduction histidine kinase/ligand-binding sensor domain-containing protein
LMFPTDVTQSIAVTESQTFVKFFRTRTRPIRSTSALRVGRASLTMLAPSVGIFLTLCAPQGKAMANSAGSGSYDVVPWRPASAVYSLSQDSNGFLWLATSEGLLRFDGGQFLHANELSGYTGIPTGAAHRVLATKSSGLVWVSGSARLETPSSDSAPFTVSNMIGTQQLFVCKSGGCKPITLPWSTPCHVWDLFEAANGDVWVATDTGLALLRAGKAILPEGSGPWPRELVSAVFADETDLWLGTAHKLLHYRDGKLVSETASRAILRLAVHNKRVSAVVAVGFSVAAQSGPSLELSEVGAVGLWPLSDGTTWTASDLRLGRRRGSEELQAIDLPPHAPFYSTLRDREGNFWLGTLGGGLLQVRPRRLSYWGKEQGLPGITAFSVLVDRQGTTWVSASDGIASISKQKIRSYKCGDEVETWAPRGLAQAPDGAIWAAGNDLVRYSDDRFRKIALPASLGAYNVRALHFDKQGGLWVALNHERLVYFAKGTPADPMNVFHRKNGLCSGGVTLLTEDAEGNVLVGSSEGGISSVHEGVATCRFTEGIGKGAVLDLAAEPTGGFWVSWAGQSGLSFWKNEGSPLHVEGGGGVPAGPILGIKADANQNFWLATEAGLVRIKRQDLLDRAQSKDPLKSSPLTVDLRDGMPSQLVIGAYLPNLSLDDEGRVSVVTMLGLVVIEPPERWPLAVVKPQIDAVLANGQLHPTGMTIELEPEERNLEIRYAVPSFLHTAALRTEYQLAGVDRAPVVAGSWGTIRYPSLTPGHHNFELRVVAPDGRRSADPIELSVFARPRLTERAAFYVVLGAMFALLLSLAYWLRLNQVRAKLHAVLDERRRIARDLHDGISQGFASMGFIIDGLLMRAAELPATVTEPLRRIQRVLEHVRTDARRALWDLRSPGVEALKLRAAIERAVEPLRLGAAVELRMEGEPELLSRSILHEVPLIVAEAAANEVRHGAAPSIIVTVDASLHGLRIRVAGQGGKTEIVDQELFLQGRAGSHGVLNIQARAQRLNGKVRWDQNTGGVIMTLEVPLKGIPQ